MKLELKHLAGYLPYKLQIEDYEPKFMIFYLTGANIEYVIQYKTKPILRPLSDLTKEIEVNGEKFVPVDEYNGRYLGDRLEECINSSPSDLKFAQFHVIEQLLEWHFDIYGLIEKGLAIDINNLNK